MKPLFVVFEGLDGSGTSTQSESLIKYWRAKQLSCALTCEPSSGPVGQMIRQTFKGRLKFHAEPHAFDRQLAYLFAADRFDHLNNPVDGVFSLLKNGVSVVSTRYIPSSFAYHCSSEEDWDFVSKLNDDFPMPDLMIYLRNPVQESISRLSTRTTRDSYENATKLKLALENYERYMESYKNPLLIVDATLPQDVIHKKVLEILENI
ncbi:dTMP kinase [Acidovorax sp. NCPPB 3859]|nr:MULTISPECIES: dTMP kinase [unclassified Acidovorax]MDA8452296.1 dTMP kinase [Acidovorax sp. GBBC 3297]MDA8461742.1 dTMP kinase [Acidovorax sp. GBBC 3333]MDA8466775.1 dTMP kinase [Acidovorax sp. GBBC 3332]MDA8471811.1 dTMP kinase [Acidovorax sp. GBBC 3299]WCM78137.1 dTMP kinase [Acidovorax sp. GBBC 712]